MYVCVYIHVCTGDIGCDIFFNNCALLFFETDFFKLKSYASTRLASQQALGILLSPSPCDGVTDAYGHI